MEGISFNFIGSILAKFCPKRYSDKIIPLCYQHHLKTIDDIIDKISAEKLQELLRNVSNIENINIAGKADIVRLINAVFTLLELVEERSSLWNKLLCNNDEYIAELVRSKLSNEWLWIIAIYFLQGNISDRKNVAIKYRLFEHIQHLNEYSFDELGAVPNEKNDLFLDEYNSTPKGDFVRDLDEIEYLLNYIRSEFLPQE